MDASQQVDTGIVGEKKIISERCYCTDRQYRDKQLNTAESLESPEAISLSQAFLKLYNQIINLYRQYLNTHLNHLQHRNNRVYSNLWY